VAVPFEGANYPGTLSYAFDGHFSGFDPSGAIALRGELTEKVTFTAAAPLVCGSSRRTWIASRDKQPTQPASRPAAGSYHGPYLFGVYGDIRFFVSPSGSQLQDVDVPGLALHCTPGTTDVSSGIVLDSVPLTATGSFIATTTRAGNYLGHPATYDYTFRGHVHGVDASGAPRLAGSLLVTMTYSDTADRSCTSNVEPWYATRDAQPRQTSGSTPSGSYSGPYLFGVYGNLRFFVSSDHSELQDIWVPDLQLTCAPGGMTFSNRLLLHDLAIKADGSFSATAREQGVHLGAVTTFTYVLRGHVHGTDSSGTPRLAGSLLETADYTGTTAESCTSGVQPWYATRDVQPTQTTTVPPSGSYRGPYLFGAYGNLSFDVSGDQSQLQDVSIPNVVMNCAPDGSAPNATITLPSVTIASDRSFDGTSTEDGTYAGVSATWTYTFSGRFHATGSDGNERAAGALSATLSYTKNGTPFTCTSNQQPWSAELG